MKSVLSLLDHGKLDIQNILGRADKLHDDWHRRKMPQTLIGQRVGLWFYGTGFRNRVAFELGVQAMGGTAAYVPGELGAGEPVEDVARYLSNWFDILVVRARRHELVEGCAKYASIPVINARTDRGHPCEILGDLQFIRRHRGSLDNLRVVFVGEYTNLCRSWLEAAALLPIGVTQVCPPGYEVSPIDLKVLRSGAAGTIGVSNDLDAVLSRESVDVLYTDCWPVRESDDERVRIEHDFLPYQIRLIHLECLSASGVFLPCPPVTRGEEATADAVADNRNLNYQAKEFLLHAQNALMELAVLEKLGPA